MDTDALIQTLAREPELKGPSSKTWLAISVTVTLVYSIIAILTVAGARQDFSQHMPWIAAKMGLSLLFAAAAVPLLFRLSRPEQGAGVWAPLLGALMIGCMMTVGGSLASVAAGEQVRALTGGAFPICAIVIPTVATPSGVAIFLWLRKQAPTQPAMAGMSAGTLAGALAATAYALTCPVDSAAFVAMWYPLAISACAAMGALAGRPALRW